MSLRFKRYFHLIVWLALILALLVFGFGSQRIIAYTVKGGEVYAVPANAVPANAAAANDTSGNIALFDNTVVHEIQILISETDYQTMLTTYHETGAKDYFHADVTIDGTRVNNVGLRLKGNASLRSAVGGGRSGGGMPGGFNNMRGGQNGQDNTERPGRPGRQEGTQGEGQPDMQITPGAMPGPGGGQMPAGAETAPELQLTPGAMPGPGGGQMPPGGDQMPAGGGVQASTVESGSTTKVPLMIKFDEYVEGQTYQGYTNLAVRTYGTTPNAAMLSEPVTNAVFRLAGLPAAQTAYAGVSLNGADEQLFVISEIINQDYIERNFPGSSGVLYKAEVGSNMEYLGEDPSQYARKFTQQTRVNDADMAPLIEFLRFIDEADDETFNAELSSYIDIDALATYLAVNNLLVNQDSLVGMNNNYYLYYDETTQRFSLLYWDGNESLAKMGRGSSSATFDIYYEGQQEGRGGGMRMGGENQLVKRFMANPEFLALYEQKLKSVYAVSYQDGAITNLVNGYASVVSSTLSTRPTLANAESYTQAVDNVLGFLQQRAAYLTTTPLLGGVVE